MNTNSKKVLWLIPARSGSKGIPDKNIKKLGNFPLLSYRIKSVLLTSGTYDLWVSTDSVYYAEIARSYGAEIPFIRPSELASDTSSSMDVVLHAMKFANSIGNQYDYIGLLEPTSPFITSRQLDEAIYNLENDKNGSSIVAVKESRPNKLFVQKQDKYLDIISGNIKKLHSLTRQSFDKEITPSGGFFISKWGQFLEHKTFYTPFTMGYEVDPIAGVEIDENHDWLIAEFILEKGLFKPTEIKK